MGRPGFIGRLMLILTAALLAMIALTVGIDHLAHRNVAPAFATPFPRVVHGAGVIALVRGADVEHQRRIVRFGTNATVHVEIVDGTPPVAVDEMRAPHLEARLRAVAPPLAGLEAYTVGGKLTRIVAPLGDGRTLIIRWLDPPAIVNLTVLGLPPGVWAGIDGLVIAGLALLAISREMRPLRRLTEAVGRFDGGTPPPVFDDAGAPDVRRLVRAVRDMQQRVATLLGERSFLVGAISHDLRIYLTRLRLRAEMVPEAEARDRLIADLDGMAALIDTSLAFARATSFVDRAGAGKACRIDLGDLVAVEVEERAAQGPRARLEGRYADDAIVAGDPVALRRVIANVLDNALRFARDAVTVRVERTAAREHIVIEDDGPGIPAAARRRVFDPFFSADGRGPAGSGLAGSGLGLAIARQIVEAHGGTIEVLDAPGAAFLIALPSWRG